MNPFEVNRLATKNHEQAMFETDGLEFAKRCGCQLVKWESREKHQSIGIFSFSQRKIRLKINVQGVFVIEA